MLLDLPDEEAGPRFGAHWPFAAAVGLAFAALAWPAQVVTFNPVGAGVARATQSVAAEGPPQGSLSEVGMALFGPFALPFEIVSLVLLAAIVGAIVLARRRPTES